MNKIIFIFIFSISSYASFTSLPKSYDESTPIFFTLHGCKQNEVDLLADSFLLEKAKDKVIFFAPRQHMSSNADNCWNWFMPMNQHNTPFSETAQLMNKLKSFIRSHGLKKNPVYLIGFSAGAAASMNFLACYPEFFAGIATHSALPYRVTDYVYDVNEVIAYGPKKSTLELIRDFNSCSQNSKSFYGKKMIFFHGTDDIRVTIKNFQALESQIIESYDYRDDRRLNSSVAVSKKVKSFAPRGKHAYQKTEYFIEQNSQVTFYEVDGMKHSWSGGPFRIERNDPQGPEATKIILDTFLNN